MFCRLRIQTSPTSPSAQSLPVAASATLISTPAIGLPAERSRCFFGPSGSWSSGASALIAPVVSVQNSYSIDNRSSEDVLRACEKLGLAFLPWYPLGAGSALRSARVRKVAARVQATPAQVAIAWLLSHSRVMLPIPGTASLEHLEENARAAKLALSPQDMKDLDGRAEP